MKNVLWGEEYERPWSLQKAPQFLKQKQPIKIKIKNFFFENEN
jgi:hypothetical protein